LKRRGISNLVASLAMGIVILSIAAPVLAELAGRSSQAQSSVAQSPPMISVFAFSSNSSYQVIVYNYGSTNVPKAYIIYNSSSGLSSYVLGSIPSGSYIVAEIEGYPISYADSLGTSIPISVVNQG